MSDSRSDEVAARPIGPGQPVERSSHAEDKGAGWAVGPPDILSEGPLPPQSEDPVPVPRSTRDQEILRALAQRINPGDAGAHNNLGVVYFQKGLYQEAISAFERALELDPRMQVARRNIQIAYFHTGYFEQLIADLRARIAVDPNDHEARYRIAVAYGHAGDEEASIREWEQLLEARPDDSEILIRLARAEYNRGDLDTAMLLLRKAGALDPDRADIHLRIGEIDYNRGSSVDARSSLERALELDPELAEAHYLLAFVYGDLGLGEEATLSTERAQELNPSYRKAETNLSLDRYSAARYDELVGGRAPSPEVAEGALAHYNLGLAFRQRGLLEEADREFEFALERGEDKFVVEQARAELFVLAGRDEEAGALYDELLEREPTSPKLWNERGVIEHRAGDLDEAVRCYQRALELDSAYALAWNNLGVVQHHLDDDSAEASFRAALRQERAPADVWRNLALMLARRGELRAAVEGYRRALELEPRSALAWTGFGAVLMETRRVEEARAAFIRAIDVDPDLAEARYQLAYALSALGDYRGALRETKRALELDPYVPTPRFRLLIDLQFEEARVLAPELDMPEEIEAGAGLEAFDFEQDELDDIFSSLGHSAPTDSAPTDTLESEPDPDPASRIVAARDAFARGKYDEASELAQAALSVTAERAGALLLLGEVFLRRGLAGEALERFTEAESIADAQGTDPDDIALNALRGSARALLELDRLDEASQVADRVLERQPEDGFACRVRGTVHLRRGELSAAVEWLGRAAAVSVDDVAVLTEFGTALGQAGSLERAEAVLRRAVELDAVGVAARTELGAVLHRMGRDTDAIAEYEAALEVLPSYAPAALAWAQLAQEREDHRTSIHVLVEFLTVDPYHLDALAYLGHVLHDAGREHEAETAYRRVLRFDPAHSGAAIGLEDLEDNTAVGVV